MPPHIHISVDRLRRRRQTTQPPASGGEGRACPECGTHFRAEELARNSRVCTSCDYHFPLSAHPRLDHLADDGTWTELWPELRPADPLRFVDLEPYPDRVERAERSGLREAIVIASMRIGGIACLAAVMDFGYLGGSMGAVVGEKLTRAADRAAERALPLIVVTASGGARMQEGVLALMQMAKTIVAVEELRAARVPLIVVLAHPTTGGVWASFASVGDVTYAEPRALIAFSGPRVIEQTTREKLPETFGRAEAQLAHGQVDAVVDRRELPDRLARVLGILRRPAEPEPGAAATWAREGRERAARAAQALPALSKRLVGRGGPNGDAESTVHEGEDG